MRRGVNCRQGWSLTLGSSLRETVAERAWIALRSHTQLLISLRLSK